MFLLSDDIKLESRSIMLCDDKKMLKTMSYEEVISISNKLENLLTSCIKYQNICLGLVMDHNVYIPSIIISLQKLKYTFVFLTNNLDKILSDSNSVWILSLDDVKNIPSFHEVNRLILEDQCLILWNRSDLFYKKNNFRNIFCLVQTSGSTGENKQIKVTNACIEANVASLRKIFKLKSQDIIFWGTKLTFDPTLIELILALQYGACLLIVPKRILVNPKALYNALFSVANITFLQMVPSVFLRWNEEQLKEILLNSQLRILAFGGENFPRKILNYERRKDMSIFNLYGISEVSCWATLHEITDESCNDDIPIGHCLAETVIELRDKCGTKINGGNGEIFIGSSTRICYINEECELSGLVFRETGDLAEERDGKIFLLGRKNKIIKRFGHRVNLTIIENKIFEGTGLECKCIWSKEKFKLLVFILMRHYDLKLKSKILDKLRVKLINLLPEECFPDFIDILQYFPLTSHGKVNEKTLEKLYLTSEIAGSSVDVFKILWCRYVGVATENLDELKCYKFFEMGGNSISALQLLDEFKGYFMCPPDLLIMIFENNFEDCMNYLESFMSLKRNYEKPAGSSKIKKMKVNTNLIILWSYDLKACVDSSPLVFEKGNKIYIAVGSFSHKFVIFHESGQIAYEISLPNSIESTPSISPCKNFILVGCLDGVMYCLDYVNKDIVWQFATGDKIKSSACFCRRNNAVVFGSYDHYVYCVSLKDGTIFWKTLLDGSISANSIYDESKTLIYIATIRGTCVCLNEDGQILWKYNCQGPIFGTPCLVNSSENIVIPTVQGVLYCLQTNIGKLIWKHQAYGQIFSSIVHSENKILFGSYDKYIHVLNISDTDCKIIRKVLVESEVSTTPFICNINGNVIVTACNSGTIHVIDFSTFELLSNVQLPGEVFSSPFVCNGRIYVGCRDNNFYCIEYIK